MKNPNFVFFTGLTISVLAGSALAQPTDSFHLMQIEQVIGGVNGDTTRQAIQVRMRSSFQNLVSNARLVVRDSAGLNPIIVKDMTTDVTNFAAGDRVLIASPAFVNSTSPVCTPDFTFKNLIPPSYLVAGRLTFEDDFGTIYWSLAWGGAAYTGSNLGSLTNSPSGNFGPPFGGPCPTGSTQALKFLGAAAAAAGANSTDYALTVGAAVFTNNARANFTVVAGPAPCYANCDASTGTPNLTANDFQCFLNKFAAGESYANCDASTGTPNLTANDFQCFLNKFAAGCT